MTQEDKDLLLKDLCARLPYRVKLRYVEDLVVKKETHTITLNNIYLEHIINGDAEIRPYLRPLSSMTDEEKREYAYICLINATDTKVEKLVAELEEFFCALHLDFRGLIEKGLAIKVTKENNPYKI